MTLLEDRPLVVVGELNPYGMDPRFALYHLPRHASGDRLRRIMGLSDHAYAELHKVNLCYGKWSLRVAREHAARLVKPHRRYVLLGAKVRQAFGHVDLPFFYVTRRFDDAVVLSLPHPSGLSREWNKEGAVARARSALEKIAPEVLWGRDVLAPGVDLRD